MAFSSIAFGVFFIVVFVSLWGLQRLHAPRKAEHILLLIASYFFYGWWDWRFCGLMLLLTFIAYFAAKQIAIGNHRKAYQFFGVAVPLFVLGLFKYFNFFIGSFCDLFGIKDGLVLSLLLPVGISFYTFQSLSYTIDVARGKLEPADFLSVSLYISFFPQLVAGPIVKASYFLPQLAAARPITLQGLAQGVQIMAFGFFKKVVLADHLSVFVDDVFAKPLAFSSLTVYFAMFAYAIQIYCDFSGYSDIAIGCANCLGYDLSQNFNLPYCSKNPTEFWKRWHISLSSWLQEYLYIPLGGNRKGKTRTYCNLLITMLLGGLWHGANWNFVIWGGLHGLALGVHKAFRAACAKRNSNNAFGTGTHRKSKPLAFLLTACSIVACNLFVSICWVFFRANTLEGALAVLSKLIFISDGIFQPYAFFFVAVVFMVLYHLYCAHKTPRGQAVQAVYPLFNLTTVFGLTAFFTFVLLILGLANLGSNPFIYFQF